MANSERAGNEPMDDDEIEAEIRRLLGTEPTAPPEPAGSTTDKPRKIVVCHPDLYQQVQKAVVALGHGDVLVQPNRYVPGTDAIYVIDNPKGLGL